jgi:hypothetical protein
MATPLASSVLQPLRPVNQSGQPTWTCTAAEILGTAPAGTATNVERTGVQAFSIVGITINSAPTPAQMAAALVSGGQASKVYYIESWAQDGRILGTGWVTWWYIGVYSS